MLPVLIIITEVMLPVLITTEVMLPVLITHYWCDVTCTHYSLLKWRYLYSLLITEVTLPVLIIITEVTLPVLIIARLHPVEWLL